MAGNKPENSATKQELVLFTDNPVSKLTWVQMASICIKSLVMGMCTHNPGAGFGGKKMGGFLKLWSSHLVSFGFSQRLQND